MKSYSNSRDKICPSCQVGFLCCIENCWCADLPNIVPISDKSDCYCPDCLKKMIAIKIKDSGGGAKRQEMTEGEDYYFNEQGNLVFTALHHLKRGCCCRNGCKHCPYGFTQK